MISKARTKALRLCPPVSLLTSPASGWGLSRLPSFELLLDRQGRGTPPRCPAPQGKRERAARFQTLRRQAGSRKCKIRFHLEPVYTNTCDLASIIFDSFCPGPLPQADPPSDLAPSTSESSSP